MAIDEPVPALAFSKAGKIAELRELLAGKYPHPELKRGEIFRAELGENSHLTLPKGAITEIHGSLGSSSLLLCLLLKAARENRVCAALIDGSSSFELEEFVEEHRFLWVLGGKAIQAIQAVDILLRDGNLGLILLDLRMSPEAQLRRIPSSVWHRLQRLSESTSSVLAAFTPHPLISSARVRLRLPGGWTLDAMRQRREEMILQPVVTHRAVAAPGELKIA